MTHALHAEKMVLCEPAKWAAFLDALDAAPAPSAQAKEDDSDLRLKPRIEHGIATLEISGPMIPKCEWWMRYFFGAVDTWMVRTAVNGLAADASVNAVILKIDSCGGLVGGVAELSRAIATLSEKKETISYTDNCMASAAFWAGMSARGIVASESAVVGSVGTVATLIDSTEQFKARGLKVLRFRSGLLKSIGTPGIELSPEEKAFIQTEVDSLAADFKAAVKRHRPGVADELMDGRTLSAKAALRAGVIDAIQDFETLHSDLLSLFGK